MLNAALEVVLPKVVRGGAACLGVLPAVTCDLLGGLAGALWYHLVPIRRGVAAKNVALAFPDLPAAKRRALVAANFRHLGRTFFELLWFAHRPPAQGLVAGRVEIEGREHLDAALARGRGVLVLSAHLGNFELLVRLAEVSGRPAGVVTRSLSWGPAERAWRALRAGGPTLLPAGRSARATVRLLREGGLVAFVLDQHASARRAERVPFFGRPAATSPDLARLARLTRAPVVPVFVRREGRGHVVRVEPALELPDTGDEAADVRAGTAQCAAVVEAAIRRTPEQWLWIHRRWKG